MFRKSFNRTYHTIAVVLFFVLLVLYIDVTLLKGVLGLNRIVFLIGTIVISVLYILTYRRHDLMCFESIFLVLYILCVFFQELILDNLSNDSMVSPVFYHNFSTQTMDKGLLVQSLALIAFLMSSSAENNRAQYRVYKDESKYKITTSYRLCVQILSVLVLGYIGLLFLNGTISSWFYYSNSSLEYNNTAIVYLTVLFMALTVYEFTELTRARCNGFKSFIKQVDKLYLGEISVISVLLLISGNRNEALLILSPLIFAYSAMIKHISNKTFILGIAIGAALMVVIGVTRQFGVSVESVQNSEISLFEVTRDFGFVDKNTNYLIDYTDTRGPMGFKNAMITLASSIPYLGGIFTFVFDLTLDPRTQELTTSGMQLQSNMDSGLGTSLIGDLYCTGTFIFVILFMYFLGLLIAYLHNRFVVRKSFNQWLLVIYLFLMANVVYYIRAEWTMPFRYIGFTFILILFFNFFSQKAQVYK